MRLFIALEIPAVVRENLAGLMEELRGSDAASSKKKARWVPSENLHVTLKFIGNVEAGRVEAIGAALAEVRSNEAINLRFQGLGFFPSDKRPRVLWAGIAASRNLAAVASAIDAKLERVGIPRDTRAFAPHLTLARFDPPGISDGLRSATSREGAREFGVACCGEFHLFESKTRPSGAEYTRLSSFPFVKAEA